MYSFAYPNDQLHDTDTISLQRAVFVIGSIYILNSSISYRYLRGFGDRYLESGRCIPVVGARLEAKNIWMKSLNPHGVALGALRGYHEGIVVRTFKGN